MAVAAAAAAAAAGLLLLRAHDAIPVRHSSVLRTSMLCERGNMNVYCCCVLLLAYRQCFHPIYDLRPTSPVPSLPFATQINHWVT